jgi:hypothetical protein
MCLNSISGSVIGDPDPDLKLKKKFTEKKKYEIFL